MKKKGLCNKNVILNILDEKWDLVFVLLLFFLLILEFYFC